MQVRIGCVQTPREIDIELGDDAEGTKVVDEITAAMGKDSGILWLTDRRGRRIGVVTDKIAYVEVGPDAGDRRVGFSAT